ncbi:TULIP family P47-like protein [Brevibacterium sp. JNUCC-42]|nr:TULIP family P47-like protein [Brevibacterium sp. JNUCC-42]
MNTYGWDVVHVGTIDFMNKQLKKYMNDNKITFTFVDENTSVTLTFDNWEIVPGGASKLLRVKTLVKEGELIFNGGNPTKLNGICPVLELQLGFFQQSNMQKLAFNFLVKGEREGDQREGAVTVINPDINQVFSQGSMVYTFLNLTLADMFINNKGRVSHIFAELNRSTSISWMKPEKYKYSYYSPTAQAKGFLVIFSVVTNRDISTLPESIDGAILDNNHDSFLVLSEKLFLEHIVMPELPNSFGHGATINHFRFESTSPTTGVIKNTRDLGAAPVRSGLIDYYPVFTNLNIKVEGNKLHMKASGKCDVTGLPGGYISFDVEAKYSFSYDRNNKRIQFNLDSTPKVHTEQHIPAWVWVTGLVWIGIIYGMVSALESSLATALRINLNTNIGKLKADVVRWSGMDQEEITDCVLDVALCIKGTSERVISGVYQIVSALNNSRVLHRNPDNNIVLAEKLPNPNNPLQKWSFVYDAIEGAYQIRTFTGSAVIVRNVSDNNVYLKHPYPQKEEYYWILQYLKEEDSYIIKNKRDPNYVLDVDGGIANIGTNIKVELQHDLNSPYSKAQKFKLERA